MIMMKSKSAQLTPIQSLDNSPSNSRNTAENYDGFSERYNLSIASKPHFVAQTLTLTRRLPCLREASIKIAYWIYGEIY